jgi:hypothetical protein
MGKVELNKRCLLITGTIVPNSIFVAHTNAEQRLNEYYNALLFYRREFQGDDLYFLENSSYDFSKDKRFQDLFKEMKIQLMKFPVSDKFDLGKGYQEFEMLDGAIDILADKYHSFIKITGRYKVLNLAQIATLSKSELIIDCHKKPGVAQTNVFSGTLDFYSKHLKNLYKEVNDAEGIYIEKIVYKKLIADDLLKKINPFSSNPLITGISGSYGGTLNRNKIKLKLRNMERKFMRLFGIKQFLIEY